MGRPHVTTWSRLIRVDSPYRGLSSEHRELSASESRKNIVRYKGNHFIEETVIQVVVPDNIREMRI